MANPPVKPRSFAVDPKAFGRQPGIQWKQVDNPVEKDRLRAAQIQHQFALKIVKRVGELGLTVKAISDRWDSTCESSNGRLLRGDTWMGLDYIAQADRILGNIL